MTTKIPAASLPSLGRPSLSLPLLYKNRAPPLSLLPTRARPILSLTFLAVRTTAVVAGVRHAGATPSAIQSRALLFSTRPNHRRTLPVTRTNSRLKTTQNILCIFEISFDSICELYIYYVVIRACCDSKFTCMRAMGFLVDICG
jgi:hypothetical protein